MTGKSGRCEQCGKPAHTAYCEACAPSARSPDSIDDELHRHRRNAMLFHEVRADEQDRRRAALEGTIYRPDDWDPRPEPTEDRTMPATGTRMPCFSTAVDQHQGDHEPTGLRMTQLTEVRTDFSDYFPGIDWGSLPEADRDEYGRALEEIHAEAVALASLDLDRRGRAQELIDAESVRDPWDVAAVIRRCIRESADD